MTINQRHYIQVGRTLYDVKTFANILKLHSPIFKIDTTSEGVVIKGKGLGTPLGMSQHSANEMAKQKKNIPRNIKLLFIQEQILDIYRNQPRRLEYNMIV